MEYVLEAEGLGKRFARQWALRDCTIRLPAGHVAALVGPNGAGKSTLLHLVVGLSRPDAGTLRVLGAAPYENKEVLPGVGFVAQDTPLYRDFSADDLVRTGARLNRHWDDDLARPRLAQLGIPPRKPVGRLSGGQRRRLDVAIGIVGRPELLFLDEPTVGFDPSARRDFHDLVHRLADVDDTTILLTTHDLDEAEKLADRILILNNGEIIADGSADQLSLRIAGQSEIRWTRDGSRFVHSAADATAFVRELFAQHGAGIADLEVRRASLEETYMTLVHDAERAL